MSNTSVIKGKRIEIDLGNGVKLCAEEATKFGFNEIEVFLEKNGEYFQTLANVGESYAIAQGTFTSRIEHNEGNYFVQVWADEFNDSYTDEFEIKQYDEPEDDEEEEE